MDGGEDEIVLVEKRRIRLIAGRVRWVERKLGQEAFAGRKTRGDLLELNEIGASDASVGV